MKSLTMPGLILPLLFLLCFPLACCKRAPSWEEKIHTWAGQMGIEVLESNLEGKELVVLIDYKNSNLDSLPDFETKIKTLEENPEIERTVVLWKMTLEEF